MNYVSVLIGLPFYIVGLFARIVADAFMVGFQKWS